MAYEKTPTSTSPKGSSWFLKSEKVSEINAKDAAQRKQGGSLKSKEEIAAEKEKRFTEEARLFAIYVQKIIDNYPPTEYVYVGIGASCDLVLEYIRQKDERVEIIKIPISAANIKPIEECTPEEQNKLCEYVQSALGYKIIKDDSKKLLIMDVTSGGTSLINMGKAVENVLRQSNADPKRVESLSLNQSVSSNARLVAPIDEYKDVESLTEENMKTVSLEDLIDSSSKPNVIRKGNLWIGETSFDDDDNVITEYYPSNYDKFIKGEEYLIGKNLDNMKYKELGRIYPKIPMIDILNGVTTYQQASETYNEEDQKKIMNYAKKLILTNNKAKK